MKNEEIIDHIGCVLRDCFSGNILIPKGWSSYVLDIVMENGYKWNKSKTREDGDEILDKCAKEVAYRLGLIY